MEEVFCKNDLKSKEGVQAHALFAATTIWHELPRKRPVCARHLCIQMKIDISVTKILKKYEQRGKT